MHFCQSRITKVVSRGRLGAAGGQRGEVWGPPCSCLARPSTSQDSVISHLLFVFLSAAQTQNWTRSLRGGHNSSPAPSRGTSGAGTEFFSREALGFQHGVSRGRAPLAHHTSQVSRAVSCQAATSRAESTEPARSTAPQQAKPKQSQQSLPGEATACQIARATRHPAHGAGSQRAQGAEQAELYCRVHSWLASLQPNAAAAAGREGSREAEIKLAHGLVSQAWRWKALGEQEGFYPSSLRGLGMG